MLMDGLLNLLWLVLVALAFVQATLLTAQTWEHFRFAQGRFRKPLRKLPPGRVLVVAPCRGLDLGMRDNLRPLFLQDHPDYQLRFVVESKTDAAVDVIRELMAEYPCVLAELIVAGRAADCGQKVHNLRAATRNLPANVKLLAFVDSDARPGRRWLCSLIQRLSRGNSGAATGYRWFVPSSPSLSNWLAYSMNASVATLFGTKGYQLIWGGSWAVRRDVFEKHRIRQIWRGMLGDDLSATDIIHRAGLRVEFEPTCMIASPLDYRAGELASFVNRQYALARLYVPRVWLMGLVWTTIASVAFFGAAARAAWDLLASAEFNLFAFGALVFLYGMQVTRALMRRMIARFYCPQHERRWQQASYFDVAFGPIVGLAHWFGLLSSIRVRHVRWRGIEYLVSAPDRVALRTASGGDFSGAYDQLALPDSPRREERCDPRPVPSLADASLP